jgi:ABC-2 type transport system permease protein
LINPLTYMIDISRRVYLEGIGLGRLVPDLWPLAVMAVVTLSIGSWVFNRRLG